MSSMSNTQQGTRGLSSSDWTRLKRIKGAKPNLITNLTEPIYAGTPIDNTAANTFVLACIDPRYATALEEYLLQTLGANTYDLFILAGGALGGNLTGNGAPLPACSIVSPTNNWQTALLDHIQVAITLHNVTNILVIDHLDCGAYGACGGGSTAGDHKNQFNALKTLIVGTGPGTGAVLFNNAGTSSRGGTIFGNNFFGYYFTTPLPTAPNLTILNDYLGVQQTTEYFPDSTGAKVLVLGCIDPRFTALLSSFLVNYKDVQFIYDLFILAGASLGANQSYTPTYPTLRSSGTKGSYPGGISVDGGTTYLGVTWGPTFFDHVNVAIGLHNITEVWVFDHLDCGAYKAIKNLATDLDPTQHVPELIKLQGYLSTAQPSLAFKGFVMDKDGNITKYVDDTRGISLEVLKPLGAPTNKTLYSIPRLLPKTTGGSRIRFTASQYTDQKAYYAADYITQTQSTNNGVNTNGKVLTLAKVCTCSSPPYVANKQGLCIKCSHDNRWK